MPGSLKYVTYDSQLPWNFSANLTSTVFGRRRKYCITHIFIDRILKFAVNNTWYFVWYTEPRPSAAIYRPPMHRNDISRNSLTHLPLDKMGVISQPTHSNAFSWMKMFVFWSKFHWILFLKVQLPEWMLTPFTYADMMREELKLPHAMSRWHKKWLSGM